jgi:drug/metabolite transporter (DMT)-like permease
MSSQFRAAIALLTATFLYSFFGVLTRIMGFELPIFYASFTRDLAGAALLLIPLILARRWQAVAKTDWKWLVLRATGGVFGFLGSYFAFYHLPLGTAYFIFYGGSTIFGFVSGALLFGEKISRLEALSLAISLIGLVLLYSVGGVAADLLKYVVWAFAGGMGAAVWNTFSKKISGTYSATQLNGLDFAVFAVIMLALSLLSKETWLAPALDLTWLANLLFVLMFVVTGQLMIYGFKHLDAQKGSLIMLLEVVFGAVIGWLFYQEALGAGALVGGLLILLGASLPQLSKKS